MTQSLMVLAAIEAMFRVDFDRRCRARKRDPLSQRFRSIKKAKGERISLDGDILESWRDAGSLPVSLISDIRGAMKLRNWLAHGRYWTAKLGRRYAFVDLVTLADALASGDGPLLL